MTNRTHTLAAIVLLIASATSATACAARCKEVRTNYKQALQTPLTSQTSSTPDGSHMGVAISARRVDQLLDTVIRETIRGATNFSKSVDLGGKQPVQLRTDPNIADISISPAASKCATCYRISAKLDGKAGVAIPVLGERSTNLSGSIDFVAPIILRTPDNDSDRADIMLDLPAATSHGGFGLDAALGRLPASWSSSLTTPLVDALRQRLARELKPIRIASFKAPTVSAAGLTFQAHRLRPVGDGQAFFIGIRSNLPSAPTVSADSMVGALTSSGSGDSQRDIAVALPIDLVAHAVAHGFTSGDIPRSYDTNGRADNRSPIKVTMRRVGLASRTSGSDANAVDLTMGFQVWNVPQQGACFSTDGNAALRLQLADDSLKVGIRDVEFGGGPATQLGLNMSGWRDAEFLKTGATIFSTSLSTRSFRVGPTDVQVGSLRLQISGETIILGASLPVPTS
jgi:hypothetical protein